MIRPRPPRPLGMSFNTLVPNLLTLIGLCAGLAALRYGLEARFGAAVTALLFAGLIDGLDGRIARLLHGTSRFGAEFDSLADFLCFGVAPALLLYQWSLRQSPGYGYVPCTLFAVCMALRLARFNATLEGAAGPAYAYHFFTGVPAPAGAGLALFPLLLALEARQQDWPWLYDAASFPPAAAASLVVTALLLVSTLPVWNFKNFRVHNAFVLPLLLGTGLFAALLITDPWAALILLVTLYAISLPLGVRSYHRLKRAAETRRAEPA